MQYALITQKRRSIKVSVEKDGLTVTAPPRASQADIARALNSFKRKFVNYKQLIDFYANPQYFYIGGLKTTATEAKIADLSYKSLEKVFGVYKNNYTARVYELCDVCGVKISSLSFGKFRSKWGSMDCRGNLKLNKLIFMLSDSLSDYLILHELCHLRHMNHSPLFWAELEKYLPNYKQRRKKLREYGHLLKIFN